MLQFLGIPRRLFITQETLTTLVLESEFRPGRRLSVIRKRHSYWVDELEKGSHLGRSIPQCANLKCLPGVRGSLAQGTRLIRRSASKTAVAVHYVCSEQPAQPHSHSLFGPNHKSLPVRNSHQSSRPLRGVKRAGFSDRCSSH